MSARRVVFIIETNKEKDSGALETVLKYVCNTDAGFYYCGG